MVKKSTSLTLAFSGLVMLVTSIVLYLGPAGHVSHFCPWTFQTTLGRILDIMRIDPTIASHEED